ncbi:MAG: CHAT domain-containing protein [Acidobacteriota bacterium]|nr:CHAT domain-containing protein [Acidobacteriota bacterium]
MHAAAAAVRADPNGDPHMTAVATLLDGKATEAVRALESLVKRDPRNALYWSDLSAARMEDGANSNDARMSALALAAADQALTLQSAQPEALFNRALALEALGLRFAAADAWRRYLHEDQSSSWAVEARERLQVAEMPTRDKTWKVAEIDLADASKRGDVAAVERIVRTFPQDTRASGEATYLPRWAETFVSGDTTSAQQSLALARHIGAALRKVNGEGLLDEAVEVIDRASGDRSKLIAEAYVQYGHARKDYAARKIAESVPRFSAAERGFAATGHPMELVAAYYRANALVDGGDKDGAATLATHIERNLEPSYRSLHAYLLWLQARLVNGEGRHYETLMTAARARDIFMQMREADNAARLHTGVAAMLARLGRDYDAWQARRAALAEAAESGKWTLVETSIDAIARDELEGPNPEVARALLNVQVSAPSALPLMRFNALLWRSFLDANSTGGALDTTNAHDAATRIPDKKQRADAMDELRLAQALAIEKKDPAVAESLFTRVIDYRTPNQMWSHLPAIYLHRGRALRAMSRVDEAARDFLSAIELTESRRDSIRSETLRDAFLGQSEDAYGELSDLLVERGEWEQAFEIAERTRARILVDQADRSAVRLADIVATTPRDVVAAHYTTFAARTLLVVIEHGKATHHVIGVGEAELQSLRDKLAAAISLDDAAETARLSRNLHDILIAPFRNDLRAGNLLVVIPDESTYGIPFAALRGAGGRFLVDETAIAIAPTAAAISAEQSVVAPSESQVTVIADPAFSASLFPGLERLPAARRDPTGVQTQFARSVILAGEDATPRALSDAAPRSDIIHIAAHALTSMRDASLSLIALADSANDSGILYLKDVQSLSLLRRPLVVLAGCETGSLGGGKGSIRTLANAFLSAGSRAVMATLWNVDDQAGSTMTSHFYEGLARGMTMSSALRESQLRAMHSRPPREWAGFQLHLGVSMAQENSTLVSLTQ